MDGLTMMVIIASAILAAVWFTCGVLFTMCSRSLKGVDRSADPELEHIYKVCLWSTVAVWVTVGVIIVGCLAVIIGLFVAAPEAFDMVAKDPSLFIRITAVSVLTGSLALSILYACVATYCAYHLRTFSQKNPKDEKLKSAYYQAIATSVVSIVGITSSMLASIGVGYFLFRGKSKKKKSKTAAGEEEDATGDADQYDTEGEMGGLGGLLGKQGGGKMSSMSGLIS